MGTLSQQRMLKFYGRKSSKMRYTVTYFETTARQWTRDIEAEDREDAKFKMLEIANEEPCDGEVTLLHDEWRIRELPKKED